ncbi:DUF1934 domain-containing protein [Pectinatus frisingensis]|uniref:DUF1934 domain-containing protein n=1 Tax=Pectinatus frisingensis TaxID=865 RepID=UPI0018C6107D|nr:DUF1934 domain-containing protein [Pectinatus frisingensis]
MEKVILKVEGTQTDLLGEKTSLEFLSEGQYYCKNGMSYVLYDESDSNGMEGTKTLLKIAGDSLRLVRRGTIENEQFFSNGVKSDSHYHTPYGDIKISVDTKQIDITMGSISSSIHVFYDVLIDGKWQSNNELHIEIVAADRQSRYLN